MKIYNKNQKENHCNSNYKDYLEFKELEFFLKLLSEKNEKKEIEISTNVLFVETIKRTEKSFYFVSNSFFLLDKRYSDIPISIGLYRGTPLQIFSKEINFYERIMKNLSFDDVGDEINSIFRNSFFYPLKNSLEDNSDYIKWNIGNSEIFDYNPQTKSLNFSSFTQRFFDYVDLYFDSNRGWTKDVFLFRKEYNNYLNNKINSHLLNLVQ